MPKSISSDKKGIYVKLRGSIVSVECVDVINTFERLPVELRKEFYKSLEYYKKTAKNIKTH